ncbi:hypothetical protein ACHQM5_006158 [Ranunculus cassubicifolius]
MDSSKKRNMGVLMVLIVLSSASCLLALVVDADANWINHGGDIYNRRYAEEERRISPKTASRLELKWEFVTGFDISATPSIYDGTVYFPSWNGNIYAVKAFDGSLVWKQNLTELTGLPGSGVIPRVNYTLSRATPTIAGDLLLVGIYGPAIVIAVKRSTGELVWSTQLDRMNRSLVTMSGTVFKGAYYVGVSSLEEGVNISECCTFRGSMVKLDVCTGAIIWQTYTLPDNFGQLGEYAGAAIWGSSPSIDVKRKLVYVATGNLYSAPRRVLECQEMQNNQSFPTNPDACVEPENHENSFLAFDMDTGSIRWYRQLGGYDIWFLQCNNLTASPACPPGPNPDADFGEAPMMLTIEANGTRRDVVVAIQKSGIAWALDRDNGNIAWSSVAGPGGLGGGGIWGAATDEKRVYTNIANSLQINTTLVPSNRTTTAGQWVAMDANNGTVLWSIANPRNTTASGPVTVANGVVFVGSDDPEGAIYAIDARNGEILWSYDTGATVHGGAAVSNGCIFIGHGYSVNLGVYNPNFTSGNRLFCFCIPYLRLPTYSFEY